MGVMTRHPRAKKTLAEWMEERRLELDLQWKDVRRRAGDMNPQTLSNIRSTGRGNPLNVARLERALEWESGSIAAAASGGTPTTTSPVLHESRPDDPGMLSPTAALELLQSLVPLGPEAFWEGFDVIARRRAALQRDTRSA